MVYRVVTRKSPLALAQTELVLARILEVCPEFEYQILPMNTVLDGTDLPISSHGGKVSFVKELEDALLTGFADLAVHSLKDMAAVMPDGLQLAATLKRHEPRDALVSKYFSSLSNLPQGAIVGTSSLRRSSQILALRPDIRVVPCRGNVDTRLRKLEQDDFSALLLAGIGLERLGLSHAISEYLSIEQMLPACGQGAIAIQTRSDDKALAEKIAIIHHADTGKAVFLERKVVELLGAHCQLPVAVHATKHDQGMRVAVCLGYADGSELLREYCDLSGQALDSDMATLQAMCQNILDRGGDEILNAYT